MDKKVAAVIKNSFWISCFCFSVTAYGASSSPSLDLPSDAAYQLFANIAYSNPAELAGVKNRELLLGGTALFPVFIFSGMYNSTYGRATSHASGFIPYGRLAWRLNPKIVAGLNITEPAFTTINYGNNSIVSAYSVSTIVRDVDIGPQLSYQVTPRLSVGAGLDANRMYNLQLNFAVPPNGVLTNKFSNWGYGWNAGLSYGLTPSTFLNLSYYSKITHHAYGTSTWGGHASTRDNTTISLPATYTLNVIQLLSSKFLLSGTLRFIQWNVQRYVNLNNTAAGNFSFPQSYSNGWDMQLAGRYQAAPQVGVLGALSYDTNVESTPYRPVGLPTYSVFVPAVGVDYSFAKSWMVKLIYAHAFSHPSIRLAGLPGPLVGNVKINANLVDLSIKYDF